MKKSDDFSQKLNINLLKNKIEKRKIQSIETEERINKIKIENKNLYSLEFELINKILQYEKKMGEIAHNRNNVSSNISKLKDENLLIQEKIDSINKLKNKIISSNQRKKICLIRELFNLKKVNLILTESLKDELGRRFIDENKYSNEKLLLINKKQNTSYINLKGIYEDFMKIQSLKIFELNEKNSRLNENIKNLKDSIISNNQKVCNTLLIFKSNLSNNFDEILKKRFGNFCLRNNIQTFKNDEIEFLDDIILDRSKLNLGEFCSNKIQNSNIKFENLRNFLINEKTKFSNLNELTKKEIDDEKIQLKIIQKQIETKLKKKNERKFLKRVLQFWKTSILKKKKVSKKEKVNRDSEKLEKEVKKEKLNLNENLICIDKEKEKPVQFGEITNQNSTIVKKNTFGDSWCKELDNNLTKNNFSFEDDYVFSNVRKTNLKIQSEKQIGNNNISKINDSDLNIDNFQTLINNNFSNNNESTLTFKNLNSNKKSNLNNEASFITANKKKENKKEKENQNNSLLNNLIIQNSNLTNNGNVNKNSNFGESNNTTNKKNKNSSNSSNSTSNFSNNDNYKFNFKTNISEFQNNECKLDTINEDDDIFKLLQKNVKEVNDVKSTNNGEKKKRFYENYLN